MRLRGGHGGMQAMQVLQQDRRMDRWSIPAQPGAWVAPPAQVRQGGPWLVPAGEGL